MGLRQNVTLNENRYRLYREHKYIFSVFARFMEHISTYDLGNEESLGKVKNEWKMLEELLRSHAEYEEERIHLILKKKNSTVIFEAEKQHEHHNAFFEMIHQKITSIYKMPRKKTHFQNYEIYLEIRGFLGEILDHFDYEERIIMPELQRLASDEEIKEIDRISYRQMLSDQMVDMVEVLFPHFNCEDRYTFLQEIKECEPEKFESAWPKIALIIDEEERNVLMKSLNISELNTIFIPS